MKRIDLDENQRKGLASALYGFGNVVAASLIIGQFMAAAPFRMRSFLLGLALFVGAYVIATRLNRDAREEKNP